MKRAIQKYIEDELAEEIIKSTLLEGDSIRIDTENNEIKFNITKGSESLSLQEAVNEIITTDTLSKTTEQE